MGELRCATVCLPFVLSAARHCVRSHAGHVTERPRLGFPFARSAAAKVNYSCVQIGHAILRRHRITGAVQRGNSVTHSFADASRNWCFDSGRPAELNNCAPVRPRRMSLESRGGGSLILGAGDLLSDQTYALDEIAATMPQPLGLRRRSKGPAVRIRWCVFSGDLESRNPIAGNPGCCARTPTGHTATAPPSNVTNSRRLTRSPRRRARAACREFGGRARSRS